MSVPDVRRDTMRVLQESLAALVNEPPGFSTAEKRHHEFAWKQVKDLYELRRRWLKDGYGEGNAVKDKIEHHYRLLAAIYEPHAA
jgi:hypothetical protein